VPGSFYLRQSLDGHYVKGPGTRRKLRELRVGHWKKDGRWLHLDATLVFVDKTERDVIFSMDSKRSHRLHDGAGYSLNPRRKPSKTRPASSSTSSAASTKRPSAKGDAATIKRPSAKDKRPTARSRTTLEEATRLIHDLLKGGDWVSSNYIHDQLRGDVSDGMFGRVKTALNIEHRRVKEGGRVVYQWRLPVN
jgi:hypothetical protein